MSVIETTNPDNGTKMNMSNDCRQPFYTVMDAARVIGCHPNTVRYCCDEVLGEVTQTVGGVRIFNRSQVQVLKMELLPRCARAAARRRSYLKSTAEIAQ